MEKLKVVVGLGSCGIAAGANKVYNKLKELEESSELRFELDRTSCVGMCYREPLVEVFSDSDSYLYGEVDEAKIEEILRSHIEKNQPLKDYVVIR